MTNPVIDEYGNKRWHNSDGDLHREDGPAYEGSDGEKSWLINGLFHREDGPAIEWADGEKWWFINGHNITEEVNQWFFDNNFPDYKEWDDKTKILFKLTFG